MIVFFIKIAAILRIPIPENFILFAQKIQDYSFLHSITLKKYSKRTQKINKRKEEEVLDLRNRFSFRNVARKKLHNDFNIFNVIQQKTYILPFLEE